MLCPICKKNLKTAIFHNTGVNYCDQCLGVWFEEDELRQAKDKRDKKLNWLDVDLWKEKKQLWISRGIRSCPYCRLPLYEVYYGGSGVIVDICNVCYGIWLDRGEFKKIIEYLKEKANWKILHNYTKNLRREFWEIFSGPERLKEEIADFLMVLKLLNYKFAVQQPTITKIILSLPR